MKSAADILLASSVVKVHPGGSADDIRQLKRLTRIQLPGDYVDYLKRCGWAEIDGDVVYGLGPTASKDVNVIEVSIFEGVHAAPQLRSTLVPLMADGAGNHYCLDVESAANVKASRCPVVFWDHEHPAQEMQKCKLVSRTFRAWIARLVREAQCLA